MKYALLSAEELFVSMAEISSLVKSKISFFTGVAIFNDYNASIAKHSSTIKYSGELVSISDNPEDIIEKIKGECFSVKPNIIMNSQKDKFNEIYNKILDSIKLSRKCKILDLIFTDGVIIAGIREDERDTKSLNMHAKKPFSQSGTMDSYTSRLLVNLASPKKQVLDPFVGVGSILLEAAWIGYTCIGSDIDKKMIDKTRYNLNYFGYNCEILESSATNLPYREVESIVTDPPYGRSSSAKGEKLDKLYEDFFFESANSLKKGGKLVFASDSTRDWRDKIKSSGLKVQAVHFIYLHKSLSRAIYVVIKP
ncbi:TRM11 family SAM-dependent methyltransferase [Acidianus brierleyi]|uniref:tRNA (guanine(10)-N(2))-dimethyltransferase n=1 Tax=Acidianus brierleyi TaxID=41673 RepID=A0A2U9IGB3_9CREN|nr:TRM11 family methyltransferase [Acidianus brierleyi]AWR95081.1 methyltransferase [Acidianus brierleyi]